MQITDAQHEMRTAFLGGFIGQLMAGLIWALSASVSTWIAPAPGMAVLFFVSMLLFPLTQLLLRLMGRSAALCAGNTLGQLATQIAFTVPIGFILVAAVTLNRQHWFYPASMIVVGAHYLPFIFLYGMWQFGILAGVLIAGSVMIGLYGPEIFSLGGWLTAIILVCFAFVSRSIVLREERLTQRAGESLDIG
jgi:hypothetical protein